MCIFEYISKIFIMKLNIFYINLKNKIIFLKSKVLGTVHYQSAKKLLKNTFFKCFILFTHYKQTILPKSFTVFYHTISLVPTYLSKKIKGIIINVK